MKNSRIKKREFFIHHTMYFYRVSLIDRGPNAGPRVFYFDRSPDKKWGQNVVGDHGKAVGLVLTFGQLCPH